jgi:hypothetical protein
VRGKAGAHRDLAANPGTQEQHEELEQEQEQLVLGHGRGVPDMMGRVKARSA